MKTANIERFDRFINNSLSEEEREIFELDLQKSTELKNEFEIYMRARHLITSEGIKKEIENIHLEESKKRKRKVARLYTPIASIAAIGLLIIASFWLFRSNSDEIDFIQDYFEPYPDILTERSVDNSDIMHAYSNRSFQKALEEFESIELVSDTLFLYYLNSIIAVRGILDQRHDLTSMVSPDRTFHQQIRWYIGLYYAQEKNWEEARKWLSEIKDGEFQYDSAIRLMLEIEELKK